MGLWLKKERDAAKDWVRGHSQEILNWYSEGYSILAIQRFATVKVGRDLIETLLKENGIVLRGFKITDKTRDIREQTNLQRFGTKNVSSNADVKRARASTCITRFGTENAFQNCDVKEKIKKTNLERYGHQNPGSQSKKNVKISNIHKILSEALTIAGVEHQNEVLVQSGSDKRAPRIDIVIDKNLGVEVYGDYFHANPLTYTAERQIKRFAGYKSAEEIWQADLARVKTLETQGFTILVIWEHDIKHDLAGVIQRIKNARSKN
jgi:G:T-mismatch repair DNA endonuclease (very short patch repair protein)